MSVNAENRLGASSSNDQPERKAVLNPTAVDEAKVYTGPVYYFNDRMIEVPETVLVEVGKWTGGGDERTPADYLCSYYAAILLGFEKMIEWLPAGDEKDGKRKLLITPGFDENEEILSFSPEKAQEIAQAINVVLEQARQSQVELG